MSDESGPGGPDPGTSADFLGRSAEVEAIVRALEVDRPVVVVGEAGIGKTALCRAAVRAAARTMHEGGAFATLAWMPYLAVRRAAGRPLAGEPSTVAAVVEKIVGPDVLFIDDLQWADAASREVVGLLLGRIAMVLAIRDGDPGTAEALEPLEARKAAMIRLAGLDDGLALTLARRLGPASTPSRLRRVVDLAGGNPLLIEELVARGQTSSSLARAITGQVETLPTRERRALELLALAGRPLPPEAIGPAGARLLAKGLVEEAADGLAVRHSLIAEAIVGQIDPERRRDLHADLGSIVRDPAERARHVAAAGQRGEAFEIAQAALASTVEPRTRAVLLTVLAETSETEATAWRVRAATLLRAIGSPAEAVAILEAPLEGDDELLALRSAVLAGSLDHDGRHDEAWAVIESARELQPAPGSEGAIERAVIESVVLVNRGRLSEALAVVEQASADAGDAARGYRLAGHLAALRLYAGQTSQLDPLEDAVRAGLAAGDGGAAAGRAMDLYYMTLAQRGAAAAWGVAFDIAARLDEIGYQTRAAELRAESAQASIYAGELQATIIHVDSMLEEPLGLLSRQRLAYNRGLALGLLGRFEDAERTFVEVEAVATDNFDGRGAVLWCWAEVALWSGRPERALELAEASLAFTAFNDAEFVLPSMARAWAEVELGRRPTRVATDVPFRALAGAEPELRGLESLAAGEPAAAAESFDEAAALWAGFHAPHELVCRWAAGEARRRSGDGRAVTELQAAMLAASTIGFEPLAARARRSLRLAGGRPAPAAPPARAGGMLTGRERQVLELVARGLTNPEMARRMGLGRPTVARLLSNAMLKLGAESRAHAVNLVAELP